jgi:hypothetical protein
MREWLAPHATPDAFPGGVLASPVGTEIVAAVSLLVANDEADDAGSGGRLVFSCRGRIHTAAAYYAPSAGRDRYAGLHEAFRKRLVAVTVASAAVATVDHANSVVPSTETSSSSPPGCRQDRVQVDTKGSAVPLPRPTAVLTPLSLPPPSPLSAPVFETTASPGTEAVGIRRRAELLNVYRDLRRRGFDTPELADHATRTTMATDELAFAVKRLELRDRRCRTATAETNLCKLVAAFVTAESASRVPVD